MSPNAPPQTGSNGTLVVVVSMASVVVSMATVVRTSFVGFIVASDSGQNMQLQYLGLGSPPRMFWVGGLPLGQMGGDMRRWRWRRQSWAMGSMRQAKLRKPQYDLLPPYSRLNLTVQTFFSYASHCLVSSALLEGGGGGRGGMVAMVTGAMVATFSGQ